QQDFDVNIKLAYVDMLGMSHAWREGDMECVVIDVLPIEHVDNNACLEKGLDAEKTLMRLIVQDLDECHQFLLDSKCMQDCHFAACIQQLTQYIQKQHAVTHVVTAGNNNDDDDGNNNSGDIDHDPHLFLKQERAILILADVIWTFSTRFPHSFQKWMGGLDILSWVRSLSHESRYINLLVKEMTRLKDQQPQLNEHKENASSSALSLSSSSSSSSSSSKIDWWMEYIEFVEPFLKIANERELRDFDHCAKLLLERYRPTSASDAHVQGHDSSSSSRPLATLSYQYPQYTHETSSGMRVSISSANASDNWTNSKLRGGLSINMCINLDSIIDTPPVSAKTYVVPNRLCIVLKTTHTMNGNVQTDEIVFDDSNIDSFLQFEDPNDVFRMLKYALVFVGIVHVHTPAQAKRILTDDITSFIGGGEGSHGLGLELVNLGPSRSGFASSSAVACNLLKVLYTCAGVAHIANDNILLGSMALLFENKLGLKSGRQDVDGLLPNGLKILHYQSRTDFQVPDISYFSSSFKLDQLSKNLLLVNSGIARASSLGLHRGLNMRFWAYLSRQPHRFKPILQSYGIHHELIKALHFNNYIYLGKLFLDYMSCREKIDPGATQSIFDNPKDGKVLRRLFDPLVKNGIIHGGMFTGAMGGGVAMLVLTENTKQNNQIYKVLEQLKQWKSDTNEVPFQRLSVIPYSVNIHGIGYRKYVSQLT
ncbi:hypothetical protein RFI_24825, partial [Reticulomyxa filosa]